MGAHYRTLTRTLRGLRPGDVIAPSEFESDGWEHRPSDHGVIGQTSAGGRLWAGYASVTWHLPGHTADNPRTVHWPMVWFAAGDRVTIRRSVA